jgi:4-azaleucine resistance transporter AzlC
MPFRTLELSIPVAVGYVPLGMVFGFLFVQAGASWWLAMMVSLIVYAGAMQFAMIPMLVAGLPVASIALAALVINFRHLFYGLSILNDQPQNRWARIYLMFALTDETYSVITSVKPRPKPEQMVALAAINQGWWLLGTLLGAALGAQLPVSLSGLDFALAALFAVLTVEQWRVNRSIVPLAVAAGSYLLMLWLVPSHALVLAIGLCVVAALVFKTRSRSG